jgi:hypothetical protein
VGRFRCHFWILQITQNSSIFFFCKTTPPLFHSFTSYHEDGLAGSEHRYSDFPLYSLLSSSQLISATVRLHTQRGGPFSRSVIDLYASSRHRTGSFTIVTRRLLDQADSVILSLISGFWPQTALLRHHFPCSLSVAVGVRTDRYPRSNACPRDCQFHWHNTTLSVNKQPATPMLTDVFGLIHSSTLH